VSRAATTASHPLSRYCRQARTVPGPAPRGQQVSTPLPTGVRVPDGPGEPVGDRLADVLEMGRAARITAPRQGDGVVAGGKLGRHDGQLDRSRHADHRRVIDPACLRRRHRAIDQGVGDLRMPAGGGDGQAEPGRIHRIGARAACAASSPLPGAGSGCGRCPRVLHRCADPRRPRCAFGPAAHQQPRRSAAVRVRASSGGPGAMPVRPRRRTCAT